MGLLSVWRCSVRVAEVLALSAFGMLHPVTGHIGLGSTFRRARGGGRDVFLLPEIASGLLLAGDGLCLVLSFDGVFYFLAQFPYQPGSLLAAMDFLVRG